MAGRQSPYKFRLEHKGVIVAESDWSSILFAQKNKRPEKSVHYTVYNNVTGLVAGTPSAETKVATARTTTRRK